MNCCTYGIRFCSPTLLFLLVILAGCAATPNPVNPLPEGDFRERIQVQEEGDVRVSVGVPSAEETRKIFDRPLYKRRIQPVWLKIENLRQTPITFLPVALDPDYYTPLEVANYGTADKTPADALINEFFLEQSISMLLPPGEELSGFVFTKLDEGTKAFNVDIAGKGGFNSFTFFVPVPGLKIDHYSVDWDNLYPADSYVEFEQEQLIAEIEDYVCCVTDKTGENNGDAGIGMENRQVVPERRRVPLLTGQQPVRVRAATGHCLPEDPGQYPRAQSPQALDVPHHVPGRSGLDRANQPRHRSALHHQDDHHPQDRSRCRRNPGIPA
jgi:hypothetical protein